MKKSWWSSQQSCINSIHSGLGTVPQEALECRNRDHIFLLGYTKLWCSNKWPWNLSGYSNKDLLCACTECLSWVGSDSTWCCHHFSTQADRAASLWVIDRQWQKEMRHGKHELALKVLTWNWCALFLPTFHWPKKFTLTLLSSTGWGCTDLLQEGITQVTWPNLMSVE